MLGHLVFAAMGLRVASTLIVVIIGETKPFGGGVT